MAGFYQLCDTIIKTQGIKSIWSADESGVNGASHINKAKVLRPVGAGNVHTTQNQSREHATLISAIGIACENSGVHVGPPDHS